MFDLKSKRGHTLCLSFLPEDKPVLTVELYTKWYSLQLVRPDGMVEEISFGDLENQEYTDYLGVGYAFGSAYVDHVPNPTVVLRYAAAKGYDVSELGHELIVGRWAIESTKQYASCWDE